MRHFIHIVILITFNGQAIYSQNLKSLIVAEYRGRGTGNYTYLVSYNFNNGIFTSKDTLYGAEVTRKNIPGSYVRFDLGENHIYKNRFIISGTNNLIDLQTGKLLYEELDDDMCSVKGDSLMFTRGDDTSGIGFLEYSNRRKQFIIKKKNFLDPYNETTSPDKQIKLAVSTQKGTYIITLKSKYQNAKILVADSVEPSSGKNFWSTDRTPVIPVIWLNGKNFMYAHFSRIKSIHDTIISKVFIRKFCIENNRNDTVAIIDSVLQIVNNPFFFKIKLYVDKIGQLVFKCGINLYKIDIEKGRASVYDFYELGFGFSASTKIKKEYGYILKSKNKEIGRFWCTNEIASDKELAIEYGTIGANLAYPKGFKVWSDETMEWTTFDVPWICTIIGWIQR